MKKKRIIIIKPQSIIEAHIDKLCKHVIIAPNGAHFKKLNGIRTNYTKKSNKLSLDKDVKNIAKKNSVYKHCIYNKKYNFYCKYKMKKRLNKQ
jgi:hypothetical protein